jgi:hypothetical protein
MDHVLLLDGAQEYEGGGQGIVHMASFGLTNSMV